MSVREGRPWGTYTLTLKLPSVSITLHGLSDSQHETLSKNYCHFGDTPLKTDTAGVECHVYRLHAPPGHSADELTLDGQYAPRITHHRKAQTLSIIGINFEAKLALNSSHRAALGVVDEQELAYSNVIENYLRILCAYRVLQKKGVVLHSAGLVFNKKAYIFSGRSNAGKTTLTRKAYAKGARVLSDDINLLLPGETGYDAYAVPFTGEFGRTLEHAGAKASYPLAGIILLEQGKYLQTLPVSKAAAVARLLTGCPFVNTDEHQSEALFDSVTTLVSNVPVIRMLNQREDSIDDIMAAVKTLL